jgi:hypothetical protein
MSIFNWSTTPVSNSTIDGHNIAENCSPAGLNDAMRAIMADVIQYVKDTGGALATAGAANTYTVTTNATWTAYADGQSLVVQVNATNTGAATLNVDSLGAKAIKKYTKAGVAAVDADDLQAAGVYPVAYDATGEYFVLVGQTLGAISGAVVTVDDDEFTIQDNADQTKQAVFQLSGITTGTTRTFTLPDASDTLVGKATTDTLTNKSIDLTDNTLAATSLQLKTALTDETGSGAAVFAESPTLVTPALGTPASGVGTNLTGTGAGFTAGNVTTNANLTGHITSTGNAAVLGSFTSLQLKTALTDETGSGGAVFGTSPTLVTPALGTPASGVLTNATGTAAGLTSGNVTTNANLTGHVTSVGNAAVLGSFTSAQLAAALTNETGSGSAVFSTSPTFVTPALGTPASGVATNLTGTAASLTAGSVTTNANLTGHVTSVGNSAVLGAFSHAQLNTAVTDATIVSTDATQTLTNKTFDANGTGNSLSNVDIADLAAGTDGELITWDAAGTPAAVAVGTINHVLTSNGAGAAPTFQAGGSGSMNNVVEDTTPQLGGNLDFQTFKATTFESTGIDDNATSTAITIDSSKNVGIGTSTTPGATGGGVSIYRSDFSRLSFRNSTTGDTSGDGTQFLTSGLDFYVQNQEPGDLILSTASIEALRLDSSQDATFSGDVSMANLTSTGIDDNATSTAITIDASENVGIGVTPSPWWSGYQAVEIGNMAFMGRAGTNIGAFASNSYNDGVWKYSTTDEASLHLMINGTHEFKVAASGTADTAITWTSALTLDNSGAATFAGDVSVASLTSTGIATFAAGAEALPAIISTGDPNTGFWFPAADTIAATVAGAEAWRTDNAGNILIGTTIALDAGSENAIHIQGSTTTNKWTQVIKSYNRGRLHTHTHTSGISDYFIVGATNVGQISQTATTTSYTTSSDYRLKENWSPMAGASERVQSLKPINFAWKVDGSRVDGFLAHELAEVVPEAVTGIKDAVNENGDPEMQGIDQSKLVPLLTATLQEALTKIADMEVRITELEA